MSENHTNFNKRTDLDFNQALDISVSPKMQSVYRLIEKVSQHTCPVLILGESGTGKELVARSIHSSGPRRAKPFVPVDCPALVSTLVETELFGYMKGAFTGAVHTKPGLMEVANNGTLFLDEIGDLPLALQAKLLRALQEKEVRPLGSTEFMPLSVRIIAATNRDLEAAVRQKTFRQDLFFRLNVVQIKLPPLRERKSDIPILIRSFLKKYKEPNGKIRIISNHAISRLMQYDWPGNVRELENTIERAIAMNSGTIRYIGYRKCKIRRVSDELSPLREIEKRSILRAVCKTRGNKSTAARLLEIGRTTLYQKLRGYEARLT